MKCRQVGRAAIRQTRPSCVKRAVEAEGGGSPRQERPSCGEPTLLAELIILATPIPYEDAKGVSPVGPPEEAA